MDQIPADVGGKCCVLKDVVEGRKLLSCEIILKNSQIGKVVCLRRQGFEQWVVVVCHFEEGIDSWEMGM